MLIETACILWSVNVSPPEDESGRPVILDPYAWIDNGLIWYLLVILPAFSHLTAPKTQLSQAHLIEHISPWVKYWNAYCQ